MPHLTSVVCTPVFAGCKFEFFNQCLYDIISAPLDILLLCNFLLTCYIPYKRLVCNLRPHQLHEFALLYAHLHVL